GRFPAMGFHTRGEMGGVWTPPLKLVDGIWFGIDGRWLPPATRFTSGYGYTRMRIPSPVGSVTRTDFVPDGLRGALIGLEFAGGARDKTFTLDVDAHSELMSAYPWGETTPSQLDFNLRDRARFTGRRLAFRERGKPPVPNAPAHDWAALVGSTLQPVEGETGMGFRGPQSPPVICPATGDAPERCDDTEYGRGAGGRLSYEVTVPAGEDRTVWFAVAGSDRGLRAARGEIRRALSDPDALLEEKVSHRLSLAEWTQLSIPADPLLAQGIDWSKQNLADSVQVARGLHARATHAGVDYPPAEGIVPSVRFLGAGWPDYPWLFATDGEYVAFASVALGQFEPIKDHLRALRDVSDIVNERSGKVVHEVVTEGSVYFGANEDEGNTDETVKFPSAVALVWRWTGDNAFRDEMYGFTVRNMRYVFRNLDQDGDGWPEGLGNVEREGMGEEKLDVTVYTIRGLFDLAAMARSKGDEATARWATRKGRGLLRRFEHAWWMPRVPQHADSLDNPGNEKVQQRHWIGVTPMEAELSRPGQGGFGNFHPGLATRRHGHQALSLRERRCYSEVNGLYHTGAPGCDPVESTAPAERVIFTLNSAVMAVGEGNYGRLGSDQQQRFTSANRRLQLPVPDEQPGAMPEIAPSPDYGRSIDLPLNERAMVLQAWGAYGTAWPVVHQHLGVRPDLGRGRLEVVPQVPPQYGRLAGERIRLGEGSIDVSASASEDTYRTTVVRDVSARLRIGHTVPYGSRIGSAMLNGEPVDHIVRRTNRGLEVLVKASAGARQALVIHAERQ
ncbi:MAG TPA: glycogen debranching protein, partial [Actinomycetota bacterium]|nr:glycogen debranching protein [Actinomycetota bacterium]